MSLYKKLLFIQKGLTQKNNSTAGFRLTTIFSVCIIFLIIFILNANEMSTISQLFQSYGKYTASIPMEKNIDYNGLYTDNRLKSYLEINEKQINENGNKISIYNSNEEILDYTNISLIEGRYPEKNDEIIVERRLLYKLGIGSSDIIGHDFVCLNKKYTITGIIIQNSAMISVDDQIPYICITNQPNVTPNTVLLEINDIRDYKQVLDSFLSKYSINPQKCYINYDLFTSLGYTTGDDTFSQNKYLYFLIFFIILIVLIHTLGNYLKIWINNVKNSIEKMYLMGISLKLIRKSLLLYYLLFLIKNIIYGLTIAIGFSLLLHSLIFYQLSIIQIIINFPYNMLLLSLALIIGVVFLTIIWISKDISKHRFKKKLNVQHKKNNYLFSYKVKNHTWKLYRNNIMHEKHKLIISMLGIALTIAAMEIGSCYLKLNGWVYGNNTDMDYKVSFLPYYSIDEKDIEEQANIYTEINNLKEDCSVWPMYIGKQNITIAKDKLENNYIDYLKNITSNNFINNNIQISFTVIGYNEEQQMALFEKNSIKHDTLANNEAIIISKTIPLSGDEGFSHRFVKGDSISFNNEKDKSIEIVEKLDVLPFSLSEGYNTICLVINEERFKTEFDKAIPDTIYIKCLTPESKSVIESMMLGYSFLEISIPKEEQQLMIESMRLIKGFIYSILLVIILCFLNSIYSNILLRYSIKKEEYKYLYLIGMSWKDNRKILFYEISETMFGGIIFSIPIVLIVTYIMNVLMLGELGKYIYSYPATDYLYISLLFLCISMFFSHFLSKIKLQYI